MRPGGAAEHLPLLEHTVMVMADNETFDNNMETIENKQNGGNNGGIFSIGWRNVGSIIYYWYVLMVLTIKTCLGCHLSMDPVMSRLQLRLSHRLQTPKGPRQHFPPRPELSRPTPPTFPPSFGFHPRASLTLNMAFHQASSSPTLRPAFTKTKNYQHLVTPNWICNRLIYPISSLLINSSLLHHSHWHILSFSDVKLQNNCWASGTPRQRPPVECWQKWKAGVFKTTLGEGGWEKSKWNGPFTMYHCIAWAELLECMLNTQKPQ